ncbi:MFS transporter [Saccharopolyspora sp. NFXS83]|uniref:MFS transporter n=1 Tax=Saccharopolyspora sp. NFXS83 TaxID=2993560 RepID=UPI00224A6AF6|nr:MFS transporter [Saccharopolyspora sp. NFXS83]MCX2733472.1 MFS transporter [Saccharopolyspora sp. NFXS83]
MTVALLFAAWTVDYIDRLIINVALPSIGETFGLDHGERGLVVSAFFLTYALMQIPGGLLADRYGGVRMASLALLLWSVFTGLTAFAWSFTALLAVRLSFGAAQGLFPGASVSALSARSVPEQRLTANGWMQSSNAIGALLAAVVGSALLSVWDWRIAFCAVAGLGLLVFVAVLRWMPEPLSLDLTGPRRVAGGTMRVLRSPAIWGFAVMFFAYDIVSWGISTWTTSYLVERHGLPIGEAGLVVVGPTLLGAIGIVVGGRLSDRFGGRPQRVVVPSMIVVGVLLFLLPRMPTVPLFVACATVLGGVAGLAYLPCFSVPLRSLPAALSGAAAGVILFGGQLAGVLSPSVFGYVVEHAGYTTAFTALMVGPVVAIAVVLGVPQTTEHFLRRFGGVPVRDGAVSRG